MKCKRLLASTIGLSLPLLTASLNASPSSTSVPDVDGSEVVPSKFIYETIDFSDTTDTIGDSQDLITTEIGTLPSDELPVDVSIDNPGVIDPINTDAPPDTASDDSNIITINEDPSSVDGPWVINFKDLDLEPHSVDVRNTAGGNFEDLISMVQSSSESNITPIAVPLPAAFSVGLATMAGIGLYLRNRRI